MASYISRYPFLAGKGPYKLGQGVMYPVNQNPKPPARAFDPRVERQMWKKTGLDGQASLYDIPIQSYHPDRILVPSFMNTFAAAQNVPLLPGRKLPSSAQTGGRRRKTRRGRGRKKGFEFSGGFE